MGLFDAPSRSLIREYGDIYRDKADRLIEESRTLMKQGLYAEAEEKLRGLVNLQGKVVGERHQEYADGLCLLAEALIGQNELNDAETLLQRALEIRKKTLGERHPDYASCLDLMARVMLRWEDFSGAEPLLRKALEIRGTALGETHPDYAASLAALASMLRRRESSDEAEALYRRAIDIRRAQGEPDNPSIAECLRGLADIVQQRGQLDEAENFLRSAVEIERQVNGEMHPAYAATLTELASLLLKKGEVDEAEPLWRLLLDMRRQALGDRHPECANIKAHLGLLLQRRGDVKGAEALFREATEIRKQTLGDRHPEYAASLTNLAFILQRLGDLQAAEPLLRQALAIRKDVLGTRHPEYASSLVNLAILVQKRGDTTWAKMLLKEAVEIRKAVYGESHPEVAQCLAALADVLSQVGEETTAETMIRKALEIRVHAHGEEHPSVASALSSLASILRKKGDFDGAEALLTDALDIRKKSLGDLHPDYATNLGNLAWLLQRRGDRKGAEDLLAQALDIRRKLLGEHHPEYLQNLERLQKVRGASAPTEAHATLPPPPAPPQFVEPEASIEATDTSMPVEEQHPCSSVEEPQVEASDETDEAPPEVPLVASVESLHETEEDVHPDQDLEAQLTDDVVEVVEPSMHDADATGEPEVETARACEEEPGVDDFEVMARAMVDDRVAETQLVDLVTEQVFGDDEEESTEDVPSLDGEPEEIMEEPTHESPTAEWHETGCGFAPLPIAADEPPAVEAPLDPMPSLAEFTTTAESTHLPSAAEPEFGPMEMLADPCEPVPPSDLTPGSTSLASEPTMDRPDEADAREEDEKPSSESSEELATIEAVGEEAPAPVDVETPDAYAIDRPESVELLHEPIAESLGATSPARSDSMSQNSSLLSQELAAMSDRFSELGERLLTAARQLHAPGTPPSDELLQAVGACRHEFLGLRDRTRDLADTLMVACPAPEQLTNIHELTGLLDQVAEAEIRQSKGEDQRRRATALMDRVLSLSHSSNPDFAPLHECLNQARGLREAIQQSTWHSLHGDVEKLAEGEHHFADLLSLIQDRDELSDEAWATLHENVGNAFGKALAAAAARAKLVLPQDTDAHHSHDEMAASHH